MKPYVEALASLARVVDIDPDLALAAATRLGPSFTTADLLDALGVERTRSREMHLAALLRTHGWRKTGSRLRAWGPVL